MGTNLVMSSIMELLRQFFGPPQTGTTTMPRAAHQPPRAPARRPEAMTRIARHPNGTAPRSVPSRRPAPTDVTQQAAVPLMGTAAAADATVMTSSRVEAEDYLGRVQDKINKLAEEFASGAINRDQFQQLFDHYQRERHAIDNWMHTAAVSDDWKDLASEGKSIVIRTQHTAKVLGYAIYENESGIPLSTIGEFEIDPALAVPMLSSYRAATKEIFGGEMRSTQIVGGKWLCFVPGRVTTMLALFNTEPAARQLEIVEDLHRLFERANRRHLARSPIEPEELAFPHASFLGRLQ